MGSEMCIRDRSTSIDRNNDEGSISIAHAHSFSYAVERLVMGKLFAILLCCSYVLL